MSFLLAAIEERQLLGVNPQDKNNLVDYLDYAVDINKQIQAIVVPAVWINSLKHKAELNTLFEKFYLVGLVDVGTIWSPVTSISFSVLILSVVKQKNVLMADYRDNPVDRKLSGKALANGELPHLVYTDAFHQFLQQIELALVEQKGIVSSSTRLFEIPFTQLDLSRLQVAFYHPDNQIDRERYKKATFTPLEKLATFVSVRKPKDKIEGSVFTWSLVGKGNEDCLPVKTAEVTNYQLQENDIIVTAGLENAYLVDKKLAGAYACVNSYVLQVTAKTISPSYLCLYLKSELAKKYSLRVATGSIIKRLTRKDFNELSILIPDQQTLLKSKTLQAELQSPKSEIDKINQLIASKEDKGRLEDSFLLEELEKLRISKRLMIERLIKEDLKELKVCIDKGLYKSSMVICGSVLEAVILDWLSETEKHDYYASDEQISLSKAITLLKNLGELDDETVKAAHNIRTMRNLIHPRNYFQNQGKVTNRECKKLLAQLKVVVKAYSE